MYSIVVIKHPVRKPVVAILVGVRFEDHYEDIQNIKVWGSEDQARRVFEEKVTKIIKEIK